MTVFDQLIFHLNSTLQFNPAGSRDRRPIGRRRFIYWLDCATDWTPVSLDSEVAVEA